MKKFIVVILCFVTLFTVTITAYASDIQPFSNNVYTTNTTFAISGSGKATVSNQYTGKSGVIKSAKIVTKIQKKSGYHLDNSKRRKLDGFIRCNQLQQEPFCSAFKHRHIQSPC